MEPIVWFFTLSLATNGTAHYLNFSDNRVRHLKETFMRLMQNCNNNFYFSNFYFLFINSFLSVSYPLLKMTHPSRNAFVQCLMHVCKTKSAGLRGYS